MSENYEIQLGEKEFVDALNTDEHLYLNLKTPTVEILPYNNSSTINVADLFNEERQASEIYRIYGSINFLSIVNGLKKSYGLLSDFFTRPRIGAEASGGTRNILNCFDFYLCRPAGNIFTTGGTVTQSGNTFIGGATYQLKYQVLSNLSDIDIYKSGFNKNIFFDQIYGYNFNMDVDLLDQWDSFNKPVTELYLFANFKPARPTETVTQNALDNQYGTRFNRPYVVYNPGDIITDGDWVYYDPSNFEEILTDKKEYYVKFICQESLTGASTSLSFKYFPFTMINIKDYGDEIITGNISGTSEIDFNIPNYAIKIDNDGNYIWKDLLQNGYIDPITDQGVNFPFINKRQYVFMNNVLQLSTDMNDPTTAGWFNIINFGPNTLQFNKPTSDFNNLGSKC